MRITTDIHGLERVAPLGMEVVAIHPGIVRSQWKRNFRLLVSALRSRHLVIHFSLPEVIFFSTALFFLPFHRCRITTLDFFAGEIPAGMGPVVRWSFRRVARFLVYFKDTAATAEFFRVPAKKFQYVPFKINGYELIQSAVARDEGYIFTGGRSRRDFATLFRVAETLGYPVKVLTGTEEELLPHGSSLKGLRVPPNVEILHNDSSIENFVHLLTGARLVVIPLLRTRTQAGIGVCLQALAAGKCLIVSTGLGVSDVITDGQAIIVPAENADALQAAIQRAWEDAALRERYSIAARAWALPLGGEDELRRSVLRSLPYD